MEIRIDLVNKQDPKLNGWITAAFDSVTDKLLIHNASKNLFDVAMGKEINHFLLQMKVWGNNLQITTTIIGILDIQGVLFAIEDCFEKTFHCNAMLGFQKIKYKTKKELNDKILQLWDGRNFVDVKYKTEEEKMAIVQANRTMYYPMKLYNPVYPIRGNPKDYKVKKEFNLELGE